MTCRGTSAALAAGSEDSAMKKMLFVLAFALSLPVVATAADNGGGGGSPGGESCMLCRYHIWSGEYSCDVSSLAGRKGQCDIAYHMGQYICHEPTGEQCMFNRPIPTVPPVVQ